MVWQTSSVVLAILGLSLTSCSLRPISNFTNTPTTTGPKVYAWGNSQTQGYGLEGCGSLTCHPATAWPQFFANALGWTLDNQAYGGSDCADLTYRGTSLSLWDLVIDNTSRNIYGHFRNDQSAYGPLPYRVAYARGCIEAQTAWLAIPESEKIRANSSEVTDTGTWVKAPQNSVGSTTLTSGATKTFMVSGETIYLATARLVNGGGETRYTVSVDGNLVLDPMSNSTIFNQSLDVPGLNGTPVGQDMIQNFIRVAGLQNSQHTVVYTCTTAATSGCYVFYAAGIDPTMSTVPGPFVYSLSPVYNSFRHRQGHMDISTTSLYHEAWEQMVSELDGDGLQVIGLDATDPKVYNASTQSQPDGVHPSVAGHASIAAALVSKVSTNSNPIP